MLDCGRGVRPTSLPATDAVLQRMPSVVQNPGDAAHWIASNTLTHQSSFALGYAGSQSCAQNHALTVIPLMCQPYGSAVRHLLLHLLSTTWMSACSVEALVPCSDLIITYALHRLLQICLWSGKHP